MQKLLALLGDHGPLGAGIGVGVASGAAGVTSSIPEGIPPWAWAVWTVLGPIVTGLVLNEIKVRRAGRGAKLRQGAADDRLLAANKDIKAQAVESDKDPSNDGDAVKLRAEARRLRQDAASKEAQADELDRAKGIE